jgi:hypothetical protein
MPSTSGLPMPARPTASCASARRAALLGAALLLLPLAASGRADPRDEVEPLATRLEEAWRARDLDAYLALWAFSNPGDTELESRFARERCEIKVARPIQIPSADRPAQLVAQVFSVAEPRARLEQWELSLERRDLRWAIAGRTLLGQIENLSHLSLAEEGYAADGHTLRLEDFELVMEQGTLFTTPRDLGPTALVFVGRGTVRFRPSPEAEREQLRQFCGSTELVEDVSAIFARIHPGDLHRVLQPVRLDPDPNSVSRREAALRFFAEHAERSFVLDAALPGSPWWLIPSLGDAAVTFKTRRKGTLTFSSSGSEPESLALFDREKRLQICLYPAQGETTRYNEDDYRGLDVLQHDLRVRVEPDRFGLEGENTLLIRLPFPMSNLRLRLDDSLRVLSVTSREGGQHTFLRVRNQNSFIVSLGALSNRSGEIALTVRYAGTMEPAALSTEDAPLAQVPSREVERPQEEEIPIEKSIVYTNLSAWYPQGGPDDFALARVRIDVPQGYLGITGGERTALRTEDGRVLAEYVQALPGKYIGLVIGRFSEIGSRSGSLALQGFGQGRTRDDARSHLEMTEDIVRFFTSEFGPCPYPWLSIVVIEAKTPGGHSPPGMVVLTQRPLLLRQTLRDDPANFSDVPGFFLAHEIAHQWWGHGVAPQNYRERWLSEAMAHYAAALWVRDVRGEVVFRRVLRRMSDWAIKRSAEGPIHLGYRLGRLRQDPQSFRAIVYDKGALVLHMLRDLVGEEPFRAGLTSLQQRARFSKVGTEDLREALETASPGRKLDAYFDEWVYGTSIPELDFSHDIDRTREGLLVRCRVEARNLPGPVPLKVALIGSTSREVLTVTLAPSGGSFAFETHEQPRKVEVNPGRDLLARILSR